MREIDEKKEKGPSLRAVRFRRDTKIAKALIVSGKTRVNRR